MKRYALSVLPLCLFVVLWFFPSPAWAATYGKVTVDTISLYETHEETRRGYAGYLFLVKNKDTKPHLVQVKMPLETYGHYSNSLVANKRTIKLLPGQTSHLWIYQPAIGMSSGGALVTVDGRSYEKRPLPFDDEHGELRGDSGYGGHGYPIPTAPEEVEGEKAEEISTNDIAEPISKGEEASDSEYISSGTTPLSHSDLTIAVLVGRGLSGNLRDQVKKLLANCNMVRSTQQASAWPTNWIAYSQFDGVLLTDAEFDTLTPETVAALADYVSVGGVVWIRPDKKGAKVKETASLEQLRRAADTGIGVLLTGRRDGRKFKGQTITQIKCANDWQDAPDAAKTLPAVERDATPVRLFLALLILYALLIGPVLQVILKIKRRRIWMLWIIPVASLVLCVVVFTGSYLAEGFSGFAQFRNITVLDQKAGRASTVGWASFYSPLADGDGLKFSTATVLQPQWKSQGYGYNSDQHDVSIDWTSGQHFTSGWLMARTPIAFRLWKAEARREKLTIRKDEKGNFTVTNALGADAEGLRLCMPDGTWYTADKLLAGKTGTLKKVSTAGENASLPSLKGYCLNSSIWTLPNYEVADQARVRLTPGSYQVMLDGHPFVNTAITDPARDEGKTLVIGRFELE